MKKYIVLSVNDNPEYLFYLPLTVWAWRKFGWDPIVFYQGSVSRGFFDLIINTFDSLHKDMTAEMKGLYKLKTIPITIINDYPSAMIAQISRLYAACELTEQSFIMTGDIDMIPLSDYWKFNENEITTWGRDLTNYHYPICYIGMNTSNWIQVMNLKDGVGKPYQTNSFIKRDLDSMPNAKSSDPEKRWCVDQDLITDRLDNCGLPITKVFRGSYENGYPIGRVDRSAWTKNHEIFIDAHLPRGIYNGGEPFAQVNSLLHWIWPDEDFTWFYRYIEDFKRLSNG